jgi:hypothetical protein
MAIVRRLKAEKENVMYTVSTEPRMGVDIGRVIIDGDGPDTSFFGSDEESLRVPAVEDAFEGVAQLVRRFAGRVWLVSKCGHKIQQRTLRWLEARDFFALTGVDPEHVRFCKERPQKADHAKALGLTHFIDDRADVLEALDGIVANRFLFGPQKRSVPPKHLVPVAGWRDLLAILSQR